MSAVATMIRSSLLLLALVGAPANAQCPQCAPLDKAERAELNLFRLAAEQGSVVPQPADASVTQAYAKFAERSYGQVNEMYDLGLRALKWQLMASNILMVLVVLVTLSGVAMSAYQLWISGRLALRDSGEKHGKVADVAITTSTLEISPGKISIQTAFVGILVLVISAALLLLFVREVYTIHPVNAPSVVDLPKR